MKNKAASQFRRYYTVFIFSVSCLGQTKYGYCKLTYSISPSSLSGVINLFLWHIVCPWFIPKLPNHFDYLLSALQWYCSVLCRIAKRWGTATYVMDIRVFCEIWVWEECQRDILCGNSPRMGVTKYIFANDSVSKILVLAKRLGRFF